MLKLSIVVFVNMLNTNPFLANIGVACICHSNRACFAVCPEYRFFHVRDGALVNDHIDVEG